MAYQAAVTVMVAATSAAGGEEGAGGEGVVDDAAAGAAVARPAMATAVLPLSSNVREAWRKNTQHISCCDILCFTGSSIATYCCYCTFLSLLGEAFFLLRARPQRCDPGGRGGLSPTCPAVG